MLERRALRVLQRSEHPIYMFALSGNDILQIADISRMSRGGDGKLIGYQRPEVRRHIKNIVEYLNGDEVLFPHAIILALGSSVEFKRSRGRKNTDGGAESGILRIPLPKNGDPKPGWVVDGQQRVTAISKSLRPDLPVPVTAFIADDVDTQRDQFLRINSSKPLPRGLITELLPEISTVLPANLAVKKTPSAICDYISRDPESPFFGLIRRPSMRAAERKHAVITDTSIIKMLEDSLENANGCLFYYRQIGAGKTDFPGIRKLLYTYWSTVRETFPEAWGRPSKHSRLMHGAGIRAMGKLMDRIMSSMHPDDPEAKKRTAASLRAIAPVCAWTKGRWRGIDLGWNEVQNVPSHVTALSNILVRAYMDSREAAL